MTQPRLDINTFGILEGVQLGKLSLQPPFKSSVASPKKLFLSQLSSLRRPGVPPLGSGQFEEKQGCTCKVICCKMLWHPTSTTRIIATQAQNAGTLRNKNTATTPKAIFFGQGVRSTTQLLFGQASAVLNFSCEEAVVRESIAQSLENPRSGTPNSVALKITIGDHLALRRQFCPTTCFF